MDIESFSGAATVALTSTIVFVLIARTWQLLSRSVGSAPCFSDSIMREAAQRFRDEFERLSGAQSVYLSAALVFLVLFGSAHALDAERIFDGYPVWQLYVIVVTMLAGTLLILFQLIRTIWRRHRVRMLRDANIAVGHRLQRIAVDFGRVYHDVETPAGVIDHVVVGNSGAYAVNVFAGGATRDGRIAVDANELTYQPGGKSVSLIPIGKRNAALERDFRRLLDRRVRVRSVLAVPGWHVDDPGCDEHLVVNDKSLSMLKGWKDKTDYLLDEDVDALHQLLTMRCRLSCGNRRKP